MNATTCCFTGHRLICSNEKPIVNKRLITEIEALIKKGVQYFGAGGARGFDTLAATAVIKLKAQYPQIKLILVLPCRGQSTLWRTEEIAMYQYILNHADKIVYTAQEYYDGCMQKRNRHLVDNSQVCITYLRKTTGGTAYTVKYAIQSGLQVINVAEQLGGQHSPNLTES